MTSSTLRKVLIIRSCAVILQSLRIYYNDSVTLLPCNFKPHSLSNKCYVQNMFITPYIGMASVAGAVLQTALSLTV